MATMAPYSIFNMQTVFPMKHKAIPLAVKKKVLERDNNTCQKCKVEFSENKLDIHHKLAVRKGGKDTIDNLMSLCRKCHKIIEPSRKMGYAYSVRGDRMHIEIYIYTRRFLGGLRYNKESYDSIINRAIKGEFKRKTKGFNSLLWLTMAMQEQERGEKTNIEVFRSTARLMKELGQTGETYDSVIRRAIKGEFAGRAQHGKKQVKEVLIA
jgi:hypothetical protein